MADSDFEAGDVVELKSGGPPMTIKEISNATRHGAKGLTCYWFDKMNRLHEKTFPLSLLKRLEKDKKPDSLDALLGDSSEQDQ